MKQLIKKLIPLSTLQYLINLKDKYGLSKIRPIRMPVSNLCQSIDQKALDSIFTNRNIGADWTDVNQEISQFSIVETAGGVNAGDRRAIYYLLRHFRPASVLEIGTHVGASTVHAISALKRNQNGARLTSVDILNVNDPVAQPWLRWGSKYSPREMAERLGASDWCTFIAKPSLEYLSVCPDQYDFIFLDGDHSAKTVYQEIPAALNRLSSGGAILLHDYFPEGRPLWARRPSIPGPWLASKRFRSEGARFNVLPLGRLPWPTKLKSNVTSLALLVGC